MANWKYKLKIKDLLTDEENLPESKYVEIASTIKDRIDEFIKKCDDIELCFALEEANDMLYMADDEETINDALGVLYDAADFHRIWVE